MLLTSQSLQPGAAMPKAHAMGVPAEGGATAGENISPHLAWSEVPEGTRSFALLCVDPDAPSKPDDVNKPDRTVPYDLARADFHHWVLVDIAADKAHLDEGADASGLTAKGKAPGPTPNGVRGLNSYTQWFAGDPEMEGQYGGYDGPWPPFNDERRHRYIFTLFALDVPSLGLSGAFSADDVHKAMQGHVLAEASLEVHYAIYPKAR